MFKWRAVIVELAAIIVSVACSGTVRAQTATPTLTPAATQTPTPTCTPRGVPATCSGAKKLSVTWRSKDPLEVVVSVSATNCPMVPSCGAGGVGDLVSVPPVSVTITDTMGTSLSKRVTAPGINAGGCPGGADSYRSTDRLRLVFGAAMTVIGKLRVPQTQPTAPTLVPPITVTARDACGTLATATVNTCFPKSSATSASLKCF